MPRAYTLQDVIRGLQRQIIGASSSPGTPVLLDQLVQADETVTTADTPTLTPHTGPYNWGPGGTTGAWNAVEEWS